MKDLEYYMERAIKYKFACGILRSTYSQLIEVLENPNITNDEKVDILQAEMKILSSADAFSYESLDINEDYSKYINHSNEYMCYQQSQDIETIKYGK